MRTFFFLLFAANLVVFVWYVLGESERDRDARAPLAAVPQPRLAAEPADRGAVEEPPAADGEQPASPTRTKASPAESGPPPAEASPPIAEALTPTPAVRSCTTWGPLMDPERAQRLRKALSGEGVISRLRTETHREPHGWWVLIPAQETLEASKKLARRIEQTGEKDLFVYPRGPDRGKIALGLYAAEGRARRRMQALVEKGFPAQTQPRYEETASLWVDREAPQGDLPEDTLAAIEAIAPGIQPQQRPCRSEPGSGEQIPLE